MNVLRPTLIRARNTTLGLLLRGPGPYCPVCDRSSRRFLPAGNPRRMHAQCPNCSARERHRLAWVFFERETDLFSRSHQHVLHVAPEACLEPRLRRRLGNRYLTADLVNPRAMVKMDITNIQFPDDSFDVIYCSHVLEHIPDDLAAMRELRRVLKPEGWAVLLVPITADATYEDFSITDPQGRLAAFGQEDHVRRYGPDYQNRLEQAGWCVQCYDAADFLRPEEIEKMKLTPDAGQIHLCRKVTDGRR